MKNQWLRVMASLVAMVVVNQGLAQTPPSEVKNSAPAKRAVSLPRYPGGYVPVVATTGQPPGLFAARPKPRLPIDTVIFVNVVVPTISDSTLSFTFKAYRAWVSNTLGTYKLSQDSSVVNSSWFNSTDPTYGSLFTGNNSYTLTTGQTYQLKFEMNSNAALGQYTIHGLATDSSGTVYGVEYPYIMDASSLHAKTRKVTKAKKKH